MTCLFHGEMRWPYVYITKTLVIGYHHCTIITLHQLAFAAKIATPKLNGSKQ